MLLLSFLIKMRIIFVSITTDIQSCFSCEVKLFNFLVDLCIYAHFKLETNYLLMQMLIKKINFWPQV